MDIHINYFFIFPVIFDTQDADGETDTSVDATRSLIITNFVRPLTVNQVKRMLAEFGEIEVLWMDSIRTHCYVTVSYWK